MFDPHFTSRLETDNRTIWASRLDDEQLAGLICALGNFQEPLLRARGAAR